MGGSDAIEDGALDPAGLPRLDELSGNRTHQRVRDAPEWQRSQSAIVEHDALEQPITARAPVEGGELVVDPDREQRT